MFSVIIVCLNAAPGREHMTGNPPQQDPLEPKAKSKRRTILPNILL